MDRASLSVIIITKDEAHNIRDCLDSVQFADEIIVLDSGSQDETVAICQEYTDKVEVTSDWPGYGKQKARALSKATGDWVLSLDADERVTEQLANEIQRLLIEPKDTNGYYIPFANTYCGKIMQHGNWRHDRCLRLFKRGKALFSLSEVHESLQLEGKSATLNNYIIHVTHPDLHEALHKLNYYTSVSAKTRFAKGKRATLFKAISHALWSFVRGYIVRAGFLDGRRGFLLAILNAEGSFYNYAKIMLLEEGITEKDVNLR